MELEKINEIRVKNNLVNLNTAIKLFDLGWEESYSEYVYIYREGGYISLHRSTSPALLYYLFQPEINIYQAPKVEDVKKWLKEKWEIMYEIKQGTIPGEDDYTNLYWQLDIMKGISVDRRWKNSYYKSLVSFNYEFVSDIVSQLWEREIGDM